MMSLIYNFLTICITFRAISFVSLQSVQENEMGKVVFANVMYRHGDRTPIYHYANDPYKNSSYWPVGVGQLTNTGKEQHYELGQWLRVRYDDILTENYSRDIIYVRSTDVDRTLMSAECNLAGMYPPNGSQIWNDSLLWQPIPIHTVPRSLDSMLAANASCPAYEEEYKKLTETKETKDFNDTFQEVYKILNQYSGDVVTTLDHINKIYDALMIENWYNLTLPSWTKDIYPKPMEDVQKYFFPWRTWTKKLARLRSGLLVKDMVSNMKYKKEDKTNASRNMNVYSAHDSTIIDLLNTLGVHNMINPPYATCFMMELRVNSSGSYHVTMFFRNSSTVDPYVLTLPGCTPACPLDQFITLLEPVIPEDWDKECQLPPVNSISSRITLNIFVLVIVTLSWCC